MNWIRTAVKVAERANFKQRVGAVIIKSGRVISTGHNQTNRYTRKVKQGWNGSLHAEAAAIVKVLNNPNGLSMLAGATIYVARLRKNGTCGLAKPCKDCQTLIDLVRIKAVVHT